MTLDIFPPNPLRGPWWVVMHQVQRPGIGLVDEVLRSCSSEEKARAYVAMLGGAARVAATTPLDGAGRHRYVSTNWKGDV